MPPVETLRLEDDMTVDSNSSCGSDSTEPPPLIIHRYDGYSSDESSESEDEEEEPDFDICLVMSDLNANDEEAHVIDTCERPTAADAATLPKVLRFESPQKAVTPSNMSSGREVSFMEPVAEDGGSRKEAHG